MSAIDELKKAQSRLERLQQDQAKAKSKIESEIQKERAAGNREDVIQKLQDDLSTIQAAQSVYIKQREEEVAQLTVEVNMQNFEQQAAARAQLAETKDKRKSEWIARGGTDQAFEAAWPEMEKKILQGQDTPPKRQPIIKSL